MAIETISGVELEKSGMNIQLPLGLNKDELEAEIDKRLKVINREGEYWYTLNGNNTIEFIQFGPVSPD